MILLSSLLPMYVHSQLLPQLCARREEFDICTMNASLEMADCGQIEDSPTSRTYACLCKTQTKMLECYVICLDDPSMQLQKQTFSTTAADSCAAADKMVNREEAILTKAAEKTKLAEDMYSTTMAVMYSTSLAEMYATSLAIAAESASQMASLPTESSEEPVKTTSKKNRDTDDGVVFNFDNSCLSSRTAFFLSLLCVVATRF